MATYQAHHQTEVVPHHRHWSEWIRWSGVRCDPQRDGSFQWVSDAQIRAHNTVTPTSGQITLSSVKTTKIPVLSKSVHETTDVLW